MQRNDWSSWRSAVPPIAPASWALRLSAHRRRPQRVRFRDGHTATLRRASREPSVWQVTGLLWRREASALLRGSRIGRIVNGHDFSATARGGHLPVREAATLYPERSVQLASAHRRLSELLRVPLPNVSRGVDRSRLLAYPPGGYYLPHYDSLLQRHWRKRPPGRTPEQLGLPYLPRWATALLTLERAEEGGELIFPYAGREGCALARRRGVFELSPRELEREVGISQDPAPIRRVEENWHAYFARWQPVAFNCSTLKAALRVGARGLAPKPLVLKPPAGTAVIFFNHFLPRAPELRGLQRFRALAELDPCSLHMGCRVAGRKVVLATWLHVVP